jgi:hypothetical protein
VKALEAERDILEITRRIIKSAISVFEQFNDVRNNRSFAHDNDLIDKAEARFIFDAISAFLRFVKTIETSRFGPSRRPAAPETGSILRCRGRPGPRKRGFSPSG